MLPMMTTLNARAISWAGELAETHCEYFIHAHAIALAS